MNPNELADLLHEHIAISGDGNVVGKNNSVKVTKQAGGDYPIQISATNVNLSLSELPRRTNKLIFVAIFFYFLAVVGVGFVLIYVSYRRVVEVESPNGPSVKLAQDTFDSPGQTTEDAVAVGDALLLKEGFRLTVEKPFLEASEQFQIRYYYKGDRDQEKEWYDEPPPNTRPYVIRMMVENVASEDGYLHLSSDMALHDEQSITYDHDCGVMPEQIDSSSLSLGERTEGHICFLVPKEAQIEYLIYDSYEERRYFKLLTNQK